MATFVSILIALFFAAPFLYWAFLNFSQQGNYKSYERFSKFQKVMLALLGCWIVATGLICILVFVIV